MELPALANEGGCALRPAADEAPNTGAQILPAPRAALVCSFELVFLATKKTALGWVIHWALISRRSNWVVHGLARAACIQREVAC